jgi:TetR/AcrR family transcriptional repressor of nem operon
MSTITFQINTRTRLLDAALAVIRTKGYSATTVDDLCAKAGVTKGGFFHYFRSKEELAVAAAEYFSAQADHLFATAPFHDPADPVERLLAYVNFRKAILLGELPNYTCLVGTMVQEVYETHPAICEACNRCISGHAATLEADIAEAIAARGLHPDWTAESLALYTQAVIQGAFILAKAKHGSQIAADCLDHLRRHLVMLFATPGPEMP